MERIYNILDKKILIKTPFDYEESNSFIPFISEDSKEYDLKIEFKKVENSIKFTQKPLYDEHTIKIYKDVDNIIREFVTSFSNESYGYLYENLINDKGLECYYCYKVKSSIVNTDRIFDMIAIENLFSKLNTFILHSSYIKYNDKAILFSGPSGIGKSTQAELWVKYKNAEIINGDRTAIRKDNGIWNAYGLPYAGSSKIYKNITTPIKAIVVLRQSETNILKKLDKLEAFKLIYGETTVNVWNESFINTVVDIICSLVEDIPVYMLSCVPEKSAVKLLVKELEGEE